MTGPMSIYVPKLELRDAQWIDGEGGIYTVEFLSKGWIITCLNAGYKLQQEHVEYVKAPKTHRGVGPNS